MNYELQSQETKDISAALAKAQGSIENALKDSKNPHFKSTFASLASVINATNAELSKNGLAVVQSMAPCEFGVMVITTLYHSSGQWFRSYIPLLLSKNDMQGMGSAITYARRYALSAIVGITQEDDDGNSVSNGSKYKKDEEPQDDPIPGSLLGDKCPSCGGKLMNDKYNIGAKYCMSCKTKFPAVRP
jgi:hypothetical protein